jgi:hypothetical protein
VRSETLKIGDGGVDWKNRMTEELLSVGREALVYRSGDSVIKCYTPASNKMFGEVYAEAFRGSDFQARGYTLEMQERYFHIEAACLGALSKGSLKLVPQLDSIDEQNMSIKMAFVPYPTFQEAIIQNKLTATEATSKMVPQLASFYLMTRQHLPALQEEARVFGGYTKVRRRNPSTEVARWITKFEAIVYYGSSDFEDFMKRQGMNSEETNPDTIRGYIKDFLEKGKIDLRKSVEAFLQRDRDFIGDEEGLVWGEARPQNWFYTGDDEDMILIDFPRAHIGSPSYTDLVSLLYNTDRGWFSRKEELISRRLANEYYARIGVPVKEIPGRHARLLLTRIKDSVRELANYCQKEPYEIKRVLGQKNGSSNGDTKKNFLDGMFNSLHDLLTDYSYRQGEGWQGLMEVASPPSKKDKEIVRKQIDLLMNLLKDTGVFTGQIGSEKRVQQLERLLTPEY